MTGVREHDIAIVGMGARFPGGATLGAYWDLLRRGEPQFRPVPAARWDHAPYTSDQRGKAGTSYSDRVAFLDDIDQFAAAHYRISPRRARAMDPQQRLLLDVTREAVADAGWERTFAQREETGVFFALSNSEYSELRPEVEHVEPYGVPGNLLNMAATTVSQFFDLGGTSYTIDAACSSGLVALESAVLALRAGTCARALVGGAYLNLIPHSLVGFSRVGALSAAGACRPFDTRADGFVLGEGVGVVVLRPLADALADGDRVYAVIRGVGSANDGTTDGPMTPRPQGQHLAMARAYADAALDPATVDVIEAHGTATTVGDRVELESLGLLRAQTDRPCYLLSVKALIGHGLTVSGIASLIKIALAIHAGEVPPQPPTDLDGALPHALVIPTEVRAWPESDRPRRAAVNSFGFGGTNVHVVLEEAPAGATVAASTAPYPFVFSAGRRELLADHLRSVAATLDEGIDLRRYARAAAARTLLAVRVAIVAATVGELRDRLTAAADAVDAGRDGAIGGGTCIVAARLPAGAAGLVLTFPGQGCQRPGMLADQLDRFPMFAESARSLDDVVRDERGAGVLGLVSPRVAGDPESGHREALATTAITQPLLGVLGLAQTAFLGALGLRPDVVLGHSVGEFPAAAAAGAISAADAVRFLARRGALMSSLAGPLGGMVTVPAGPTDVESLVSGIDGVWPACFNDPRATTVAGSTDGLAELTARCDEQRLPYHPVAVEMAFHTPLLDPVAPAVARVLAELPIHAPPTTFVSSVGGAATGDPATLRTLWAAHSREPVRFTEAIRAAVEAGGRVFVQPVGGGGALAMARRTLADRDDCHFIALSGDEADDCRTLVSGLARLAALGLPVDLAALVEPVAPASLPVAPLATRSHWLSSVAWGTAYGGATSPMSSAATPTPIDPTPADPTPVIPGPVIPTPPRQEKVPMDALITLFREQVAVLANGSPPLPAPEFRQTADALPQRAPRTSGRPDVASVLRREVARISGFPATEIRDEQSLVRDLGFDSMLFAELMAALGRTYPNVAGWPAGAPRHPTVGEAVSVLADLVGVAPEPAPQPDVQAPPDDRPGAAAGRPAAGRVAREDGLEAWSSFAEHDRDLGALERNPYFLLHTGTARDTTRIDGRELISFSGYNYLGLSGHPQVNAGATAAIGRHGTSVSASRFLSGERPVHRDLEAALAALIGTEDAVVMVSGHATNVSVIGMLLGPEDLVVHDELAHDSILQGCALSGATRRPYPHNDTAALEGLLDRLRGRYRRCLIVTEGVFSMDGDLCDLPGLIAVKNRHGAALFVDEAHSIGVVGRTGGGVREYYDVPAGDVEFWSGTLSKSLAGCGGYVAGSHRVVEFLKYSTPGFVYSVGMTPGNAGASLAALQVLHTEPARLDRLRANYTEFLALAKAAGLNTGTSRDSAVVPVIVGDSRVALALANALFEAGISVNPILYPAVPEESARLRFFITSEHTGDQLAHTVALVADTLADLTGAPALPTPALPTPALAARAG